MFGSLEKVNIAPEKWPFQKESSLPTIIFQWGVSFGIEDDPISHTRRYNTVDGTNPAPPGMYTPVQIIG